MNQRWLYLLSLPRWIGGWLLIALLTGIPIGTASAFFLIALDWATGTRQLHSQLIWALPIAGLAVGWCFMRFGSSVERGNNLILDEIHKPQATIPFRMMPMVLIGTVISHLFGASVGREGTAIQMGGAIADQCAYRLHLDGEARRILLVMGIGAGFASVFGTPLAGTVFGLEVLAIGAMRYDALFPCMAASLIAHATCLLWGAHHTHYPTAIVPSLTLSPVIAVAIVGALFGLMARAFSWLTQSIAAIMKRVIPWPPLRPFIGGAIIALLVMDIAGLDRYIGLGVPIIESALKNPLPLYDTLGKLGFTTLSLGSGFKGGEVTPLFYIGATFGNAMAQLAHQPIALLASVGFVAVFAGAANTPLASTLMAIELFGPAIAPYALIACVISYLFSGPKGIYAAQRVERQKWPGVTP